MKAMVLAHLAEMGPDASPLEMTHVPDPIPSEGQVLIRVSACGVCHTELDEIEGRTPPAGLPVIPGHQAVGTVEIAAEGFKTGDRIGIAWIYSACGQCKHCLGGTENLCLQFRATGRDVNGGYAEFIVAPAAFAHPIPDLFSDVEAAPLLCAGAIGYRSLKLTGLKNGQALGLTGFGASAHLVLKMSRFLFPDSQVFVFARSEMERGFALELGAEWAGTPEEHAPRFLDAIIDTTPAWKPIVNALRNLEAGGRLVINAIRKEDADINNLLQLNYAEHLWMEKEIKSVANVTREDVRQFLGLAADMRLKPEVQEYGLAEANLALRELKQRKIRGAKVLRVAEG